MKLSRACCAMLGSDDGSLFVTGSRQALNWLGIDDVPL